MSQHPWNPDKHRPERKRTPHFSDDALESAKRRVEAKRRQREYNKLKDELESGDRPFDPDAVYLTVRDVAERYKVPTRLIQRLIRERRLNAMKARIRTPSGKWARAWVVHPKDADSLQGEFLA